MLDKGKVWKQCPEYWKSSKSETCKPRYGITPTSGTYVGRPPVVVLPGVRLGEVGQEPPVETPNRRETTILQRRDTKTHPSINWGREGRSGSSRPSENCPHFDNCFRVFHVRGLCVSGRGSSLLEITKPLSLPSVTPLLLKGTDKDRRPRREKSLTVLIVT